ncbi:MFS transporter [Saccharibacillus sp. O16]|nr:MFS transporter [Saccharibacillus sp. O16]
MKFKDIYALLAIALAALNLRPLMTSVAPLLGAIQDELGMSGAASSLLTTLPVWCMGLFAPLAAKIGDRLGMERTIWGSLLLIAAMTALRGMGSSAGLLILTAILGGIGISLAGPLLSAFIKKRFPQRPAVISIYSASMTVGAALASSLSVPVYERSGGHLNQALAIWALLGLAGALFWLGFIQRGAAAGQRARSILPLRNSKAVQLTLFFGLMSSMFYSLTAWIAPMAIHFGYRSDQAAFFLTLFTLIQIPVSLTAPSLVSRWGTARPVLIACGLLELAGVSMLLMGLPMLPAVVALGLGAGGLFPLALMLPVAETRTPEEASGWSAMTQGGGYLIGALGPLMVGTLHDFSGDFNGALSMMLVGIVAMIGLQWKITTRRANQRILESGGD